LLEGSQTSLFGLHNRGRVLLLLLLLLLLMLSLIVSSHTYTELRPFPVASSWIPWLVQAMSVAWRFSRVSLTRGAIQMLGPLISSAMDISSQLEMD